MRLKAYAICQQIRRVKDGFVSFDTDDCLAFNQLTYENILVNNLSVTNNAQEYIDKYDKTILVGHTKREEEETFNNIS